MPATTGTQVRVIVSGSGEQLGSTVSGSRAPSCGAQNPAPGIRAYRDCRDVTITMLNTVSRGGPQAAYTVALGGEHRRYLVAAGSTATYRAALRARGKVTVTSGSRTWLVDASPGRSCASGTKGQPPQKTEPVEVKVQVAAPPKPKAAATTRSTPTSRTGSLPLTGASVLWMVGAAGALMVAGVGLALVARRPRKAAEQPAE